MRNDLTDSRYLDCRVSILVREPELCATIASEEWEHWERQRALAR